MDRNTIYNCNSLNFCAEKNACKIMNVEEIACLMDDLCTMSKC